MFIIGIDVSKAKLDCSLLTDAVQLKRKAKVVVNSKTGVVDLLAWVNKQAIANCEHGRRYLPTTVWINDE
jgi:transposase